MRFSLRNGLMAAGYLALAAVAAVGWARHAAPAPAPVTNAPAYSQSAAPQSADQYAAGTNAANTPAYSNDATAQGYNNDGCTPPAAQSTANDDPYLIPGDAPLIVRPAATQYAMASQEEVPAPDQGPTYYYRGRHARHHHRSLKKSLAVVGGTAGVGAAIGGIAAGGRGAALGAVTGGAAGFLYDRLTSR